MYVKAFGAFLGQQPGLRSISLPFVSFLFVIYEVVIFVSDIDKWSLDINLL
jgi:hypothetical protein